MTTGCCNIITAIHTHTKRRIGEASRKTQMVITCHCAYWLCKSHLMMASGTAAISHVVTWQHSVRPHDNDGVHSFNYYC